MNIINNKKKWLALAACVVVGTYLTFCSAMGSFRTIDFELTGTVLDADTKQPTALMQKYICTTCHAVDRKIVGPAFMDVAKKYPGQVDYITKKIQSGGAGIWGPIPMPAQKLSEAEARTIATWIAGGAGK